MKKYIYKASALLGLFSLPLCAQNVSVIQQTTNLYGNNLKLGSSRYNAMGGAMGAMGGDVSSINVNPAGLGTYISGDIQASFNVNRLSNTSTLAGKSIIADNNDGLSLGHFGIVGSFADLDQDVKNLNFAFTYGKESFNGFVRTAANPNITLFDKGAPAVVATSTTPASPAIPSALYKFEGHQYNTNATVSKMNFALGANINHKYYLGLSINSHYAEVKQADFYKLSTPAAPQLITLDKQETPFNEISRGLGLSIGAIAKISQEVRLGLAIDSPTGWQIKRTYKLAGVNYNEDRTLYTPAKVNLSASVIPSKSLALNADFIQEISTPSYSTDDNSDGAVQLNNFYRSAYGLVSELRLGAEYRIDAFRLRTGYSYASSPYGKTSMLVHNDQGDRVNETINQPYIGDKNTYSAGLGYHLKSFYLDMSYQNTKQAYGNVFYTGKHYSTNQSNIGPEAVDPNNTVSIVSQVQQQQHVFMLTVGCKF